MGESTLHPDFVKLWNRLTDIDNVELSLTSNGVLLDKILDAMYMDSLKNIIISVDGGNREAHNAMRGRGTFERTMRAVKKIDSLKREDDDFYLQLNTVITKLNVNSLRELPNLFEELEGKNIILNLFKLSTDSGNARRYRERLECSLEEIKEELGHILRSLREVNERRRQHGRVPLKLRLELFTLKEQLLLLKNYSGTLQYSDILFELSSGQGKSCGAYTLKRIFVNPHGYVFPCFNFADPEMKSVFIQYAGSLKPPSFVEDDFLTLDDILKTPFFQRAREWIGTLYPKLFCASCKLRDSCTVCPVYAYLRGVPNACKEG